MDTSPLEMPMRFAIRALVFVFLASQAAAQTAETAYPRMAPLPQYLMPRDAEIALARSAAPESVADAAEILVLTRSGFEKAVEGTNGFVCMVARSWSADWDDPDFWDPKVRAPICYNALAARSQVAATMKRTQAALAGGSQTQILDSIKEAVDRGELPTAEVGSMSYMLSKGTYLNHRDGRWLPHLMFFVSEIDPKSWGAGLPESPIFGFQHPEERLTVFVVPVNKWSDGTLATSTER
jgi:hypothetical protein